MPRKPVGTHVMTPKERKAKYLEREDRLRGSARELCLAIFTKKPGNKLDTLAHQLWDSLPQEYRKELEDSS